MITQIEKNMNTLEQLAVAIFRLVSTHVNGASPHIKVNPYTINLGKNEGAVLLDTESEEAISPDELICKDVDVMWFYPKAALQAS